MKSRKAYRKEWEQRYNSMTDAERDENDRMVFWGGCVLFIIAMIVGVIIIAMGGKIK